MLNLNDSLLLVVDPQECFVPYVVDRKRVTSVIKKMISVAQELEIPIMLTEHYPKGLKPTVPEVLELLGDKVSPLPKVYFSCLAEPSVRQAIEATGKKTLVVVGVESHICITQTCLDAKAAGFEVFLVADGVSSRGTLDHELALNRLAQHGVEVITWEVAAYEWTRRAACPEFKRLLPHIKSGVES